MRKGKRKKDREVGTTLFQERRCKRRKKEQNHAQKFLHFSHTPTLFKHNLGVKKTSQC
jgi:hypothetical protein